MSLARKIAASVLAVIGVAGLSFGACNADRIAGPPKTSDARPSADLFPGEAIAVTIQTIFQQDDRNECTQEFVHTDGRLNSTFHLTPTPTGKFHIKVHYNTQGNTGFVVLDPAVHPFEHEQFPVPFINYKVIENDDAEAHFDEVILPYKSHYTAKLWLKRDGEAAAFPDGDDYFEHIVADFTVGIDPDDPTKFKIDVTPAKFWFRCQ